MKIAMKTLTDNDWKVFAVRVLGYGDWINMIAELDSLEKKNVQVTTKKSRHLVMKKSFEDSDFVVSNEKKSKVKDDNKQAKFKHKIEATKRAKSILKEVENTNMVKIDDSDDEEEVYSHIGDIISSEDDELVRKRTKFQLQSDVDVLILENKKLKKELLHYKNISDAQKESKELLQDLKCSRKIFAELKMMCCNCQNQESYSHVQNLSINKKNRNYRDLQEQKENSQVKVQPKTFSKIKQSSPFMKFSEIAGNNSDDSNDFDSDSGFLKCDKNIIKTEKVNTFESILLIENEPNEFPEVSSKVLIESSTANKLGNTLTENANEKIFNFKKCSTNDSTEFADKICNLESSLMVDLGHGVKINKRVLEKVRKKELRHLILDLLNALFTKIDFATCSRSGKKGKLAEKAKPELDSNKRCAIVDYATEVFKETEKDDIEALMNKIIANKCRNATKSQRN
ncbi:uncharacterized protein LOC105833406 [Monomorium pharaonis]|uniref:uncharacterized protein LOC105833406 n=1 Tax=Monomorium pharaonis TaxID=307658 RepID=UPI00174691EA|nr:uncharacterized protein LOC105833406 [Monomorium pharaonis]